MVQLTLPKNSRVTAGKTWPKPAGATRLREYRIYRFDPESGANPRLDTYFVDLDDCVTGPAIQDLWMLLAGSRDERQGQMRDLLEGYDQFGEFDRVQLGLIEPLRALRMIHYAGWLARRWSDPAFPLAFPWFGAPRYWEDHVRQLVEQLEALDEPPLQV